MPDLDTVRDHALVILFNEDHFGTTQSDIGPVEGAENIEVEGWIAKESINWNPEQGFVRFTAYTAHYWFGQIPAFPDGVEFTTGTPTAWTEFQDLTVRQRILALSPLAHHRHAYHGCFPDRRYQIHQGSLEPGVQSCGSRSARWHSCRSTRARA